MYTQYIYSFSKTKRFCRFSSFPSLTDPIRYCRNITRIRVEVFDRFQLFVSDGMTFFTNDEAWQNLV